MKGAKVKFGGRSGKTDSKGQVTLDGRKGTADRVRRRATRTAKLKLK